MLGHSVIKIYAKNTGTSYISPHVNTWKLMLPSLTSKVKVYSSREDNLFENRQTPCLVYMSHWIRLPKTISPTGPVETVPFGESSKFQFAHSATPLHGRFLKLYFVCYLP